MTKNRKSFLLFLSERKNIKLNINYNYFSPANFIKINNLKGKILRHLDTRNCFRCLKISKTSDTNRLWLGLHHRMHSELLKSRHRNQIKNLRVKNINCISKFDDFFFFFSTRRISEERNENAKSNTKKLNFSALRGFWLCCSSQQELHFSLNFILCFFAHRFSGGVWVWQTKNKPIFFFYWCSTKTGQSSFCFARSHRVSMLRSRITCEMCFRSEFTASRLSSSALCVFSAIRPKTLAKPRRSRLVSAKSL